jgi:hypothetical protein
MSASLPLDNTRLPTAEAAVERARAALDRIGLLLFSDPALPSLVGLLVDEPLRTSWWGHPRGPVIYEAMNRLEDDPRVVATKLVAGKVTYVDVRLWPALVALATAGEDWQLEGLSAVGRWLLGEVEGAGRLQTDAVALPSALQALARGRKRVPEVARELERRLLVHAAEVHTPSGAHAKVLQTWTGWAQAVRLPPSTLSPVTAREALEASAARLADGIEGGTAELPWRPRPGRGSSKRKVRSTRSDSSCGG